LDNGVFSERFDKDYWIGKMNALLEYSRTCAFIVAPDVIGNCKATIDQFKYYRDFIINYPAAFVSQDGIINHAELIPWDSFDVLFVGGSDGHKLGTEGAWIIAEAKTRKKWVHVGRVNSVSRIIKFHRADSWDGTHLGFFPSDVKKFHAAVSYVRLLKKSNMLIGD